MFDFIKIDIPLILFCLFIIYVLLLRNNKQIRKFCDWLT